VGGVSVLASVVEGVSGKDLRDIADKLKDKLGTAIIVLAVVSDDKVSFQVILSVCFHSDNVFFLKLKYHDYFCQFSWQVVFDSVLDKVLLVFIV
jgi:hypothetical protein